MNFIFDVGNVLMTFRPRDYLEEIFTERSIIEKLLKTIWSPLWLQMDRGTITEEEAYGIYCAREPEYKHYIRQAMERLRELPGPMPEVTSLLPEIKAAGHGLYYLSNYPKELSDYILANNDFFNLFDGGVFSCNVHLLKPYPEIYRCFLDKYSLAPEDCIFFDDMAPNVAGAEQLGIKGVLFTGAEDVSNVLAELNGEVRNG